MNSDNCLAWIKERGLVPMDLRTTNHVADIADNAKKAPLITPEEIALCDAAKAFHAARLPALRAEYNAKRA